MSLNRRMPYNMFFQYILCTLHFLYIVYFLFHDLNKRIVLLKQIPKNAEHLCFFTLDVKIATLLNMFWCYFLRKKYASRTYKNQFHRKYLSNTFLKWPVAAGDSSQSNCSACFYLTRGCNLSKIRLLISGWLHSKYGNI